MSEEKEPLIYRLGDPGAPCMYRWRGPRGDAPMSVDVEHVCPCWADHKHAHWCPCGAWTDA